jgi:nucleoside-diphosphate-sugar epimerase
MNDQLRTRGSANILECLQKGSYFYCQAGFAFLHSDHGGEWITETSPLNPSKYTESSVAMEKQFLESENPLLRGVSFRFSVFYHQDAWHTQAMIRELRKRRFPIIGDGEYFWNMIHVDDAAAAVLWTLERRNEITGREVMIVSDDEPVTCKEFLHHLARLLDVPEPTRIPQFVAKLALSGDMVEVVTASFRCRNDRMKSLGWKPVYRSFREGFPAVLQFI